MALNNPEGDDDDDDPELGGIPISSSTTTSNAPIGVSMSRKLHAMQQLSLLKQPSIIKGDLRSHKPSHHHKNRKRSSRSRRHRQSKPKARPSKLKYDKLQRTPYDD